MVAKWRTLKVRIIAYNAYFHTKLIIMIPFQIGNWLITDDEIKWVGTPQVDYAIPKDRLNEPGPGNRSTMYDWLVHIPEKAWCAKADVYTLNTAFVYAQTAWGIGQDPKISFVDTFVEQAKVM